MSVLYSNCDSELLLPNSFSFFPFPFPPLFFIYNEIKILGYGHLTISTTAGKVFTVLYSIVGIPIFVITSQQVGLHLCTLSKKLYKRIEKRPCLKRRRRLMALLTNLSLGKCVSSAYKYIIYQFYFIIY